MKKIKLIIFIIPFSVLFYSIFFEPLELENTFHEVTIGNSGQSLVVAHVTDLHTKGLGEIELKVIDSLNLNKPDIIFITGDITTPSGTSSGYEEVLSKLKAPLGTFFVQGNWEYWEPEKELNKILKKYGIVNLTNNSINLNDNLWLVGLDDQLAGTPSIEIYKYVPKKTKVISLFHTPILFESIKEKSHLAFAGHSHGGQARLPFIGALWTPEGTGKYDSGWFQGGIGKMYVSRGIGNSILPIRFNCRPELAYIKINY
jgi:predicted MPP superfamily phosphohydrolase